MFCGKRSHFCGAAVEASSKQPQITKEETMKAVLFALVQLHKTLCVHVNYTWQELSILCQAGGFSFFLSLVLKAEEEPYNYKGLFVCGLYTSHMDLQTSDIGHKQFTGVLTTSMKAKSLVKQGP